MNVYDLIKQRRTVRKFTQEPLTMNFLRKLVDAARVCPSAANLQPLRYKIVADKAECDAVFKNLHWAGYLSNGTPTENERPTAYIIVAQDMSARQTESSYDVGAAMMAMTLCAQEAGVGHCWFGSVERAALREVFHFPEDLRIVLVLALGYPAQNSIEDIVNDGDLRYWLDEEQVLHVPKHTLEDVLL